MLTDPASLLWYDLETTGTDPARDRITQFAAVRTDSDLREIGTPESFFCAPALDSLPHPEACLITGIIPQDQLRDGLPEAAFMARIHALMTQSETCVSGYNSMRFDDEFMRYSLYRNFFDPYAREWQRGNSRWDIIDLARMAHALRPEGVIWPQDDEGRPSFRLELLASANKIEQAQAHDALSDVYATIGLARLIRSAQPRLYQFFFSLRRKQFVRQQLDIAHRKPVLHVSGRYPAQQHCIAVVVPLTQHPRNSNGIIVYDLSAPPEWLLDLDVEEIRQRLFTPRPELPEGKQRIPLKTIHLNRSPAVAPLAVMRESDRPRLGIDVQACMQHASVLAGHGQVLGEKLQQVYATAYSGQTNDPELQLYDGFLPDADRIIANRVSQTSPEMLAPMGSEFQDSRLGELLFRYRARNFPHCLSDEERARWERYRLSRLQDDPLGTGLTLSQYPGDLAKLRQEGDLDARQLNILSKLEAWADFLAQPHPEAE